VVIWLMMLAPMGVFIRQLRQVRSGAQRTVTGTVLFFAYSVVPALAYIVAVASLVGIEEVMGVPLVSESLARSLPLAVGVALAEVLSLTCGFALAVRCFRKVDRTRALARAAAGEALRE
jgi:hypothetical protein